MSIPASTPSLIHHTTLHPPSHTTRSWSSRPHPSPSTPFLATAESDKSVNVYSMRDWKLLSTISGGHKRSVRCVGWKDYGGYKNKRRKGASQPEQRGGDGDANEVVMLATGSFDANVGLWVWNREYGRGAEQQTQQVQKVPGSFGGEDDEGGEMDFTRQQQQQGGEEENEEWHFSTLLTGPDSEIKDLKFAPATYGANLLATCSRDKSVWVWEEVEPEEWETVAVLSEHQGDVKCLAWCEGAAVTRGDLARRIGRRKGESVGEVQKEEEEEVMLLGQRELLASGSYDDTIRLHHDDEAEGDWLTIAVLVGHEGTVWDLKFENFLSLVAYPTDVLVDEVVADWSPRLASCSDDLNIKIWKKELNEKEQDQRKARIAEARQGKTAATNGTSSGALQTGFSSARIPSVIRPPTSTEKWAEEATLPPVHVRSVYAVDWSDRTGLIVSCGGDGLIAVYKEFAIEGEKESHDVVMNGTEEHTAETRDQELDLKKHKTEWRVISTFEAAHDEYEINHVCWAPIRDRRRQLEAGDIVDQDQDDVEEYIVSTGDDGQVRVWQLPAEALKLVKRVL